MKRTAIYLDVKKDKEVISKIIKKNIEFLNINFNISQKIADNIILYLIKKETPYERAKNAIKRLRSRN